MHSHGPGYSTQQPVRQVPTSLPRNIRAKSETSKSEQQAKHANVGEQRFQGNSKFSSHISFKDSFILKETMFLKLGFS